MPGLNDSISELPGAGVSDVAGSGAAMAGDLLHGFESGAGNVFGAGQAIGSALISGVMQPLGASGDAIAGFADTVIDAVGGLTDAALGAADSMLDAGTQILSAVSALGGAILTGLGFLLGPGGAVVGALIGAGALLATSLVGAFLTAATGLLDAVGKALGELGKVAGEGLKTLLGVVEDVFDTALAKARSVGSLAYGTGTGFDVAGATATNFGALGVDTAELARLLGAPGMSPTVFGVRAGAFGLPGYGEAGFAGALAQRYQETRDSGPFGFETAQAMLGALGLNTQAMLRLANLNPARIAQEQAFSGRLQNSLGVNPDMMRRMSEDVPLVMGRFEQLVDMVKTRFAGEMIDRLGNGLERVADVIGNNADAIIGGIEVVADWFVNVLPLMILDGVSILLQVGEFFLNGLALFLASFAADMTAFGQGQGVLFGVLHGLAELIDGATAGFKGLMMVLAPLGAIVFDQIRFWQDLVIGIMKAFGWLFSQVDDFISQIPGLGRLVPQEVLDMVHGMRDMEFMGGYVNPMDQFDKYANMQTTNLTAAVDAARNSPQIADMAKIAGNLTPRAQSGAAALRATRDSLDDPNNPLRAILAQVRRGSDASERTARAAERTAQNTQTGPGDDETFGKYWSRQTAKQFTREVSR